MNRTAGELARILNTELRGSPNEPVSGVAEPESARPVDLIYVESEVHAERARKSPARCVLAKPGAELAGKTVLISDSPKLAFAKAAEWLMPRRKSAAGIHPTAIVSSSSKLGEDVSVGPYAVIEDGAFVGARTEIAAFCYIGRDCEVGEDCRLDPHVTLYAELRLGRGVVIHAGAVIGGEGFGYVFGEGRNWKFPQIGRVEIGDDVEIGCNSTVDRGSLGTTRIGEGAKLDNLVHVAHNVRIGRHTVIAAQTGVSGSSSIGERVVVGGQVGIADHCEIRNGAVLGAQAGVPTGKTIPAGQTAWGTPARPLDKFKEMYAHFARLPQIAERLQKLEKALAKKGAAKR